MMPTVCKQSVPDADKSIKKINKMLESKFGKSLPLIEKVVVK